MKGLGKGEAWRYLFNGEDVSGWVVSPSLPVGPFIDGFTLEVATPAEGEDVCIIYGSLNEAHQAARGAS